MGDKAYQGGPVSRERVIVEHRVHPHNPVGLDVIADGRRVEVAVVG